MTEPKRPIRELSVNIGSIYSFENNDKAWASLQQLTGRGNDYLGIEYGWDKNVWGRLGLTTASFYLLTLFRHYEHEMAHDFNEKDKGFIDVTDWSDPFSFIPMPEYKPASGKFIGDKPADIWDAVAGLNQNEYSAYSTWKRCMIGGSCTFDDNIYFLLHKLEDLGYIPKMTKGGYGGQIAISDLFSWPTWESVYSIANYLIRGKRERHVAALRITENFAIAPPLTSLYLTSDGSFFNNSMFFFLGEKAIELNIGTDFDALGDRLDTMRFGGSYYGLQFDPVEINPFAALDVERSTFDPKGFSSGLEVILNLTSSAAVRAKLEYNRDDVMENTVKREPNGANAIVGVDVKI